MLLRLLLEQPSVTCSGEFFAVDGMSVGPLPTRPKDLWLGGRGIVLLACLWSGVHFWPADAAAGHSSCGPGHGPGVSTGPYRRRR